VAVLGASADRISEELNGLPVTLALNAHWNEGIGSSIRAGLAALAPAPPGAVVIMLCDQPLVPAQFLDRLVAVHLSTGKGIVAAEYGDGVGVPALFDRAYFPDLAALRGSQGAKPLLFKYASHLARIPLPEAAFDVDREEDMRRLEPLNGGCWPPAGAIVQ
jgi:molybdenum cofactor cytidylyltransferase